MKNKLELLIVVLLVAVSATYAQQDSFFPMGAMGLTVALDLGRIRG